MPATDRPTDRPIGLPFRPGPRHFPAEDEARGCTTTEHQAGEGLVLGWWWRLASNLGGAWLGTQRALLPLTEEEKKMRTTSSLGGEGSGLFRNAKQQRREPRQGGGGGGEALAATWDRPAGKQQPPPLADEEGAPAMHVRGAGSVCTSRGDDMHTRGRPRAPHVRGSSQGEAGVFLEQDQRTRGCSFRRQSKQQDVVRGYPGPCNFPK